MDSHLFPLCLSQTFYPTLSPNGLIVLASFLILNLSYFISNNKNNKETEEKSPAILLSYYGNYAHFPVFSSNSSPYKYIFYTAILAMAPHSSTFAWKIPWTEEPGRLQSMRSQGVGHNLATSLSLFTFMHWRRKWQPTPVFLPGESQGQGSLVGCHL